MKATYETCAQTAKRLRKALKTSFPGVKFSVRSSTYSGGASIDVSWDFGPTEKSVDEIAQRFAGSTFDGMIDLKSSLPAQWVETLDGAKALVHNGADFVFCRRGYGADEESILRVIAKKAGEVFARVEYSEDKALYLQEGPIDRYDLGVYARQVLGHSDLPKGFNGVKLNEERHNCSHEQILKAI